ncbi:hypothetical protein KADA111694_06005 [Kaistella daneshvariae]
MGNLTIVSKGDFLINHGEHGGFTEGTRILL